MKIFLAGHVGFYNRGCEALVRVIVQELTRCLGRCTFVVPSNDAVTDRARWPESTAWGVQFVPFHPIPDAIRWWDRVARRVPSLADLWWPMPELPNATRRELADSDLVIVTGGDVMSLDYQGASLLRWVAQVESALRRKIPVALWASSIGPFSRWPAVERQMARHLQRYSVLSTRESHSQAYLASLGLSNSVQTADPAFLLAPQSLDLSALMPPAAIAGKGVIGFNVSPVLAKARAREGDLGSLERDILEFWRYAVRDRGYGVLLIPHVDSPDGGSEQSDSGYMGRLLQRAGELAPHVRMLAPNFNAAQLKAALAACRLFIGARTHATIGALSSGVPTVSIAYSVKAKGINHDLFGHLEYVLDTPTVSLESLIGALERLERDEDTIRTQLARRVPEVRVRARLTAELVAQAVLRGQAQAAA